MLYVTTVLLCFKLIRIKIKNVTRMPEKEYILLIIFASFVLVLILCSSNKILLSVSCKHEN